MRRLIAAGLALTVWAGAAAGQAQTLRFAPLPMEKQETVVKQFRPLTAYLEQALGVRVVMAYFDNYADILEQFRRGQVDLAYLGPLPYVQLRKSTLHARPLVRFKEASGQTTYTCALVTFPDNFFDVWDVSGETIALTQPLSTCGYLSASGLIRRTGGDIETCAYRYLNKHDAVALSVVRGAFDAGSLKSAIARKYSHLGLRIVFETPPLPAFALVGNDQTLPAGLAAAIGKRLVGLDPTGRDRELMDSWGRNIRYGAVPAADEDYRVVRELLGGATIPAKGNF